MSDEIILTPQEYKDLEDDIKFKESTRKDNKYIIRALGEMATEFKEHVISSQDFRDDVNRLKIHRTLQWIFIFLIITTIVSGSAYIFKTSAGEVIRDRGLRISSGDTGDN